MKYQKNTTTLTYDIFLIFTVLSLSLGSCTGRVTSKKTNRPNVVFILADDQRKDMLSCNGNPAVKTPNLDQLAREGCNFINAFTVSGVCSPSRAVFFTGKYAHQCRAPQIIWDNHSFKNEEIPFPVRLHDAGYYTAHIGKWHLGKGQVPKEGYDFWAGFEWLGSFYNTTLHINGVEQQFKGYSDDILSKLAAEKIKELSSGSNPFCLFLGLKAPHLPFSYPERYEDYLVNTSIAKPDNFDENYDKSGRAPVMKSNAIRIKTFQGGIPLFGNWDNYIKSYYRASQALDDAVGRVLKAIDEAGIRNNTLVIYSSDQGYTLGEHGMTEKHYAYEQVMRIPMIIRYPDVVPVGISPEEMVLNLDLAPSVMDLCGLEIPESMTGKSWAPLLSTRAIRPTWREDFMFEYWDHRPALPAQTAVRTKNFKLITYQNHPYQELYDLKHDPEENMNIAGYPQYDSILSDMNARLIRLKKETGWAKRIFFPVNHVYVMGPFNITDAEKIRKTTGTTLFSAQQTIDFNGHSFSWKKILTDKKGFIHFPKEPSESKNKLYLVSIPIKRLSVEDPHAILDMTPAPNTTAWDRGKKIWECEKGQNLGLSWYNFPLNKEEYTIRLEIEISDAEQIQFRINAPQGSLCCTE